MAESANIQVRINITDLATIAEYMNQRINQDNKASKQSYVVVKKGTCLRYALQLFAQDWLKGKHEYIEDNDRALEVLNDIYGSSGNGGVDVMARLRGAVAGDVGSGKGRGA